MQDKPRISYSEIRVYTEVYPRVKFWRFSNIFYPRSNYTEDNSASFVNKYLIGQYGHVTWRDVTWLSFGIFPYVTTRRVDINTGAIARIC